MKKATAILSALLVAVMMMAASVCAAEINLIPEDADWVMTEAGGSGASWSYGENGLTVKDNGAGWPNIAYSLETPLTVDVANATLSYKITNVNTAGNIAILITLSDTEVIVPHRLFTDEGIDFEAGTGYDSGSGDLMNGSYEGEISLANPEGCRRRQSEGLHAGRRQDHHHRNFAVRHGRRGIHGQRAVDQRRQDR